MAKLLGSWAVQRAFRAAGRLVTANRPLGRLVLAASALLRSRGGGLRGLAADAAALVRLVREVSRGRYRGLPRRSLIAAAAALIYFVNPLDLIPDILPGLGLLDDAGVLFWVIGHLRRDLTAFRAWEQEWGGAIDVEPVAERPEAPAGLLPR